jgi:hypothetical protein
MTLRSLVVVSLILATATPAMAADRHTWFGKGVNDPSRSYLFIKVDDTWTLGSNVDAWDDTEWSVVRKTGDYIELRLKNSDSDTRIRLYDDKMIAVTPVSGGEWIKYAEGNWVGD